MSSSMLSTAQVAERLGMHRDTVSRNAKNIPGARKVFGRWRFDEQVLESWLVEQKQQADTWAAPKRGALS